MITDEAHMLASFPPSEFLLVLRLGLETRYP